MTPLLLIGLIGLLVYSSESQPKKPGRTPSPEIPTGPGADKYEAVNGHTAYRRHEAVTLIKALLYRYVVPTEQTGVLMLLPGSGAPIGVDDGGAYFGLEAVHDQGYVLWVPFGFHIPEFATTGQFVVALPPGESPPDGYAILILPEEPWPPVA